MFINISVFIYVYVQLCYFRQRLPLWQLVPLPWMCTVFSICILETARTLGKCTGSQWNTLPVLKNIPDLTNREGSTRNVDAAWECLAKKSLFLFGTMYKQKDPCSRCHLSLCLVFAIEKGIVVVVVFARIVHSCWFWIKNMWNVCEIHLESQSLIFNHWFQFTLTSSYF